VKIQVYSSINVPANYSEKTYLYYHLVKNKIQDWIFYLVINLCINLFVILYSCSQMRFKLVLYLLTMSVPDEGYCRNASCWLYYPSRAAEFTCGFLVGSVLLILFLFCVVLLCVSNFWVPCYDVRYDFRINNDVRSVFTSSCLLEGSCLICVSLRIMVSNTYCVMFLFCLTSLCVLCIQCFQFLHYPFLIAPSVFSNVY
jgi:hypothetical protein